MTYFFFWAFVKDNVYGLPLPVTPEQLKTRIAETNAKTDHIIPAKLWQETEKFLQDDRSNRRAHIVSKSSEHFWGYVSNTVRL